MYDIAKIRADFPILARTQGKYPYTYLDSGATAQKPQVVIDKMRDLMENYNSNIHRGVHQLSGACTEMYEGAREIVRDFIGAGSVKEIIFTSGATASLNLVAHSYGERYIKKGDVIVVSEMEHHANIVPWQLLCERKGAIIRVLPFDDNGEIIMDNLDAVIDENVKIVAITEASNVLGTHPDLRRIIDRAHAVGAVAVVDGCQGIVHGVTNVTAMNCDFYAFSGHKLYAPTGIGVLYGKQEFLEEIPPYMGGGDMVTHVTFEKTTYAALPLKFEAGTTPFLEAICLGEAIKYVSEIGMCNIQQYESVLLKYSTDMLKNVEEIKIYGISNNKSPILSFNVGKIHPYDIGMILDKMGVAVRTGTHCAEPTMTHFGVTGMVRASLAMYTTKEDIDNFIKAVNVAVSMLK